MRCAKDEEDLLDVFDSDEMKVALDKKCAELEKAVETQKRMEEEMEGLINEKKSLIVEKANMEKELMKVVDSHHRDLNKLENSEKEFRSLKEDWKELVKGEG